MDVPNPNTDPAALAILAEHLNAAKMFSLACCVMLYYDILITFGDEVEKIWKQQFTFATVLWFMNRYLSPLGYIVIIVSFQDPNWGKDACNHYVLYPEVLKVFTSTAIGRFSVVPVIFILRLYSIYGGSVTVLWTLSILLLAELAVKIWAFTDGTSVTLPPGLVGCILTGRSASNDRFVFTWVAELIFDSIIFITTLSRTFIIYRRHRKGAAIPLIKIMMRDGIVYFLVIFAANVVTVTLFVVLPPDLKAVNASFSTLITSLMVSRLILNLRSQAMRPRAVVSFPSGILPTEQLHLTSNVIGNLGEPIESSWFEDDKYDDVKDVFAMEDVYRSQELGNQNAIIVEVTKSVTTDVHARSVDDLRLFDESSFSRSPPTTPPLMSLPIGRPRSMLHYPRENSPEHYEEDDRLPDVPTWRPPQAWGLEDVEVQELGRPRRSRRRPSTS